jgi:hypothetical protein
MICPTCRGLRTVKRRGPHRHPIEEPCPDCGGCGLVNCREGERPGNVEMNAADEETQ